MKLKITKRWLGRIVLVGLVATGVLLALQSWDPVPLQVLRMRQLDVFQQIKPRGKKKIPVTIVDIDDQSLTEIGQWPWPRTQLGQLVQKLMASGAVVVGFDILFPESDRLSPGEFAKTLKGVDKDVIRILKMIPSNDIAFARVLERSRVVLGQAAIPEEMPETATKEARKTAFGSKGGDPKPFVYALGGLVRNRPELEKAAKGIGTTTIFPESDGIVRRLPLLWRVGDQIYPSLGMEMLRVATGQKIIVSKLGDNGLESVVVAGVEIPTDENGRSWIYYNHHDAGRFLPAADVLLDRTPKDRLKGHLVLVGSSAAGLHDTRQTPLNQEMPGVEIQAQWLETVLTQSFLQRPNYILGAEYLITAAFCLILTLTFPLVGAIVGSIIWLSGGTGAIALAWYFFDSQGILLSITYPIIVGFLLYSVLVLMNYLREEKQRREVQNAFSHFLSPELVSQIADDPSKLKLSGETRELTFLFTDLASFTSLVESIEPDLVVSLLNDYLDVTCRIVMEHGGTIDKIVGDAIHAMFGAPSEQQDHASRAVACALELDAFCRIYEKEKQNEGIPFGITRIGINTGTVVVGNFGGSTRFDYTAHGDAINSAARMESVNKHLGTRICVSGSTANQCTNVRFRPVGGLILKGKTEAVQAFEPVSDEEWNSPRVKAYLEAFQMMKDEVSCAQGTFTKLKTEYPDDPLVKFHLKRFSAGDSGATVRMEEK
jgi:adenylate cyclase